MSLKYKCGICESKPDQLSHHKMHIDTQKHKDKRTIFELKLQSMTNKALVEKYKTHNINEIINKIETKKIMKLRSKPKMIKNLIVFRGCRIFWSGNIFVMSIIVLQCEVHIQTRK